MGRKQRISYLPLEAMDDEMRAEMERCRREGTPWRLDADDALGERFYRHFSEPELVELGCFIALTMGQQSWLRLLDIEHHQVLAGTSASMAPGYETAQALARTKGADDYWAKSPVRKDKAA